MDFPVAMRPGARQMAHRASVNSGGQKVLSYRATTGFGGLIVVTAFLLAVQAVTGIAAFPL
jgi:hypothetical protein